MRTAILFNNLARGGPVPSPSLSERNPNCVTVANVPAEITDEEVCRRLALTYTLRDPGRYDFAELAVRHPGKILIP